MKYYVISDTHGFYTETHKALTNAGYFADQEPHKLLMLGDIMDRGQKAIQMQKFVLDLMEKDEVVLVKGNHEDFFELFATEDQGLPLRHHVHNGTYGTALQLTGFDPVMAQIKHWDFAEVARNTPYYKQIIPAMVDYFETQNHVFVHGWIPSIPRHGKQVDYRADWRNADRNAWQAARWINGIDAAQSCGEEKNDCVRALALLLWPRQI